MQGLFRSFFTVSFYTLLSRITGFVRDIFIAKYLGSTVTADAFFVAFRIPNFFRRVLAEGAYSAALIPVFSGIVLDSKEDHKASDFVENTMSLLLIVTITISVFFYFCMPFVIQIIAPGFSDNEEAFNLAVHFGKIIFPYLIFISLVAHFTSIINVHGKFAAGAFTPAILNISFILSIFFLTPYFTSAGHALSYGVLIGGLVQFIFMYKAILNFYKPKLTLPKINEKLIKFFKLFFPGFISSGIIQLNIIIGTIIASLLPIGAISHIYYADRLNQLPLAIFGIALGTVLLPRLSKSIKENNFKDINNIQNRSLEFALLIGLPSAVGLFLLSYPITHILFERGAFVREDSYYTASVLSFFSIGLPAYIFIRILVTCFFAREDTRTPLYVSIVSVISNIILSLILIQSMREMGIAIATAVSAWIHAGLLYSILVFKKNLKLDYLLIKNIAKIFFASIVLVFFISFLNKTFLVSINDTVLLEKISYLFGIIVFSKIVYLVLIIVLKVLSFRDFKGYIGR